MDPLLSFLQNFTGGEEAPATDTGRVLTEEEHVLRKVKSLLLSITRRNFERVKDRLIEVITSAPSAFVLKGLVSAIFEMAEEDDAYILFGRLCSELDGRLPRIRSEDFTHITFKRLLLGKCQMEFENSVCVSQLNMVCDEERLKIRLLGNLKLLAELYKHKMITESICHRIIQTLLEPECVPELYIEATCQLLSSVGKQIDTSPRASLILDSYLNKLNDLAAKTQLEPRLRDIIRELLALRVNHWEKTTASTRSQEEEINSATASSSNNTSYGADDGEQDQESDVASQELTSSPASELVCASVHKKRMKRTIQKNALAQRLNLQVGVIERRFAEKVELEKKIKGALAKEKEKVESLKELVEVYMKERDDLQVERDNLIKLREDRLKKQSEEASISAVVRLEDPRPLSSFICPISQVSSQEIMNDPQVAADGFSYEAEDMRQWLNSGQKTSPMTNLKLPHCSLVPNHTLRSAIQEWLQRNQ